MLAGHKIDILIIKNSTDTPCFLTEDFSDNGRKVRTNHIYTRVGDTNTDIDKSADINNVEYLWKKRFLLTRSPFEQIIERLKNKNEWERNEDTYFNVIKPECTIVLEYDDEDRELLPEFYAYAVSNPSTMYQMLSVKYYGTQLYGRQVVVLDSGRYITPTPDWEFLYFGNYGFRTDYAFKYFMKNSPLYKLNEFLYNEEQHEASIARRRFFEVVLLFEDSLEKDAFLEYVHLNKEDFLNKLAALDGKWSWIEANTKRQEEQVVIRLKTGKVLNQMLINFRQCTFK